MYRMAFVCIDNSCRSQMAEGWLKHFRGNHIQAYSAGILPQPIHYSAITVMKEKNIDISQHIAKSLFTIPLDRLTHLITVCDQARDVCLSSFPWVSYIHWSIPDPAKYQGSLEKQYAIFRETRDQIEDRVQSLLATLA